MASTTVAVFSSRLVNEINSLYLVQAILYVDSVLVYPSSHDYSLGYRQDFGLKIYSKWRHPASCTVIRNHY